VSERMCGFKSHLAHFEHSFYHLITQDPVRFTVIGVRVLLLPQPLPSRCTLPPGSHDLAKPKRY
jgi:hypothetical protein